MLAYGNVKWMPKTQALHKDIKNTFARAPAAGDAYVTGLRLTRLKTTAESDWHNQ